MPIGIYKRTDEHKLKLSLSNKGHIAYYPELRFAIDNGRTLCIDCHKTTDTYLSNFNKNKKYE